MRKRGNIARQLAKTGTPLAIIGTLISGFGASLLANYWSNYYGRPEFQLMIAGPTWILIIAVTMLVVGIALGRGGSTMLQEAIAEVLGLIKVPVADTTPVSAFTEGVEWKLDTDDLEEPILARTSPPPVSPQAKQKDDRVNASTLQCKYCGENVPRDGEDHFCPRCGGPVS